MLVRASSLRLGYTNNLVSASQFGTERAERVEIGVVGMQDGTLPARIAMAAMRQIVD